MIQAATREAATTDARTYDQFIDGQWVAGCTIVAKPSEFAAGTTFELARVRTARRR